MTTPDLITRKNGAGHPAPAHAEPGADSAQARITELEAINRTLAEQLTAAREQHAMLERLVDAGPVVLFHANWPSQQVDYISPNLARMWGLESREVISRSGFKYAHICPEDRSRFIAELLLALETKAEQVELHYRVARHGGDGEQWARTVIHFEYGPDGTALALAGYSLDDSLLVRTEEKLRRRNTGLATLLGISQRLSGRFALTELLEVIVPCALNTLDSADAAALWLYDKNTDTLHRCHHAGHDPAALRHTVPAGEPGFLTEIYSSSRPSHVPDAFNHPVTQLQPDGAPAPIGSAAGLPVPIDKRAVGVLAVVNFAATDAFGQQDTRLLQLMAGTIGLALKNTELYQTEYDSLQFTEVIHAAGAALSQTLELPTVLDTLLAHVHKLIPYDSASVMLLQNDGSFTFDAGRGYPPPDGEEDLSDIRLALRDSPILQQIARERHSMVIEDTTRHPDWRKLPQSGHIRSWLGVPLIANDQLIGIFSLDKSTPHFFTGWHRSIAEALSSTAALSVANARLFDAVRTTSDRLRQLTQQLITAQEDERRNLARDLH
ncbi:MAG: GAF domain-containing protein, partial [Chloroflexi bacterium]|nr:GAF domain-containing protein [Chloroflexota bacterium]